MTTLLFCLITPTAPPEEALDRYVALRRAAKHLDVGFTSQGVKGSVLVSGPRMRLDLSSPQVNYTCVITSAGMRDIDRVDREYDEAPEPLRPMRPPSRLTPAVGVFPEFVLFDDLRKLMPSKAKFAGLGKRQVGGTMCDVVGSSYFSEAERVRAKVELAIDAKGAPRRIVAQGETMNGSYYYEWNVSRFAPAAEPPASRFTFAIPDGYSPFSLPEHYATKGVGATFPMQGWRSTSGSPLNLKDLLPNGGLVAVLGVDSMPSQRAATSLQAIGKGGVKVVVLGDARGVSGAAGYDADGSRLNDLDLPATPAFYRVDSSGKITRVWRGYDPAKAADFEREARGE